MRVSHGTDVFGHGKKKKKSGVLTTPIGIAVCSIFSRYTLCLYYITDQFFFLKEKLREYAEQGHLFTFCTLNWKSDRPGDFSRSLGSEVQNAVLWPSSLWPGRKLRSERACGRHRCNLSMQSYLLFRSVTRAVKRRCVHTLWSCFSPVGCSQV